MPQDARPLCPQEGGGMITAVVIVCCIWAGACVRGAVELKNVNNEIKEMREEHESR